MSMRHGRRIRSTIATATLIAAAAAWLLFARPFAGRHSHQSVRSEDDCPSAQTSERKISECTSRGAASPAQEASEKHGSARCADKGCQAKVKVSEEGNAEYAWYYLTNTATKYANVTIERRWVYEAQWLKETKRHRLYPGQHKDVFSFPRNQRPKCCITACSFE